MEDLKLAAIERGLMAIRKRKNGPIMIMESKTGKTFGLFGTNEEALAAVLKIEPLPVISPQEAGWSAIGRDTSLPPSCPNGNGSSCLCLDKSAIYLCAVIPCLLPAKCYGCCSVHYSQLKVLGDLTEAAIEKTRQMVELGEFDLVHLPEMPRVISIKRVNPTGLTANLTPTEVLKITSNIVGMSVMWTGSEYLLIDKDGIVLDRVHSREEFFEEEEPPKSDNGIIEIENSNSE